MLLLVALVLSVDASCTPYDADVLTFEALLPHLFLCVALSVFVSVTSRSLVR